MSNIDEHGSDTEDSNTEDVLNQIIMPNINKGTNKADNKIDKEIKRSWINKDKKEEKTKKMTVKVKKITRSS